MTLRTVLYLMLAICALAAPSLTRSGELYRWTDSEGRVHYSDAPQELSPAMEVKKTQDYNDAPQPYVSPQMKESMEKAGSAREVTDEKPQVDFSKARIEFYYASKFPYPADDMAREFLNRYKFPYKEYDISTDPIARRNYMELTKSNQVPFTVINGHTFIGFNEGAWWNALQESK